MMRWLVVASLVVSSPAVAGPAYRVLRDPQRTWTYDVVASQAGKPTGQTVTLAVTSVEERGAYSLIILEPSNVDGHAELAWLSLLIGPDGIRETLNIDSETYSETTFREAFAERYLPRVYVPAALKKQQFKRTLDRFREDARIYKVTGALTRRDRQTWRMTWKGSYRVPAMEGEGQDGSSRTRYTAIVDFDPDLGFTLICPLSRDGDDKQCLRLRR